MSEAASQDVESCADNSMCDEELSAAIIDWSWLSWFRVLESFLKPESLQSRVDGKYVHTVCRTVHSFKIVETKPTNRQALVSEMYLSATIFNLAVML